jgi:hypothetical protein
MLDGGGRLKCGKCGSENDEDAEFCKKCGLSLKGSAPKVVDTEPPSTQSAPPAPQSTQPSKPPREHRFDHERDWDDRCEEECTGGSGRYSWIWGALIILLGIWISLELGVKNIPGIPEWVEDFDFWWVLPLLFGILLILAGLDAMKRMSRYRR